MRPARTGLRREPGCVKQATWKEWVVDLGGLSPSCQHGIDWAGRRSTTPQQSVEPAGSAAIVRNGRRAESLSGQQRRAPLSRVVAPPS